MQRPLSFLFRLNFDREDQPNLLEEDIQLIEAVFQARQDWLDAREYFQQVKQPELIDEAIFLLEAAEKRYTYLLQEAKTKKLVNKIWFFRRGEHNGV